MDSRLAQKLQKSWAALFYEHVFRKIDESLFAPLYCSDNGRSNFPVNILMSLDLIKEIRGYTDEVLLDEYAYNFQISYALGLMLSSNIFTALALEFIIICCFVFNTLS